MKKIIGTICLIIITLGCMIFPKANIIPDDVDGINTVKVISEASEFNVMKGMSLDDFLNSQLFNYLELVSIDTNNCYLESKASLDTNKNILIDTKYYFNNSDFYRLQTIIYDLFDDIEYEFYEIKKDNNEWLLLKNEEIIISEISDDSYASLLGDPIILFDNYFSYSSSEDDVKSLINSNAIDFIYTMKYQENSVYQGKDIHFVVEESNPLSLSDLLSDVVIKDKTQNIISNYEVDRNTYLLDENNKIAIGSYSFRIIARDNYGNTVIQNCIVDVVDGKGPNIIIDEINISYKDILNDEIINDKCEITDSSGIKDITFEYDDYLANSNTLGEYSLIITAVDNYDNISTITTSINVIDDIKPNIFVNNIEVNYPYDKLSIDDIKNYITVTDEIDGEILSENIVLTDLDNYEDLFSYFGEYRFQIDAYDNSNNMNTEIITISVFDNDYPSIEFNKYIIVVPKGQVLTKEQIIQKLIESNQISSGEDVILNSLYFDTINPTDQYEYELILKDGTIINGIIKVEDNSEYEKPVKENSKNNLPIIIGVSITAGMIIIITILGVVIYKKKH